MTKFNARTLLRAYIGLILFLIMTMNVQIVHGNPVRIRQTASSLNINGKAVAKDIIRELSPEVESPIFASFEFGLGDRSDEDRYNRRWSERYGWDNYYGRNNFFERIWNQFIGRDQRDWFGNPRYF